jgi:PTS system cellobiose-specific IIA component
MTQVTIGEVTPEELAEKAAMTAMQMILHSGNARELIMSSLEDMAEFSFSEADEKLQKAYESITAAHVHQTEVIQKEACGEPFGYSILFSHAQDTVMTINSEYQIAKKLLKMQKAIDLRIRALEV